MYKYQLLDIPAGCLQCRLYSLATFLRTSPPPSTSNCLPFVHPIHLPKVSSPPSPGANPFSSHPLPVHPMPCPTAASRPSSPSAIAYPGVLFSVTAGLWSKPCASRSAWVKTGVQHASVPSNIASHSLLVFVLNTDAKKSASRGQSARLSREPGRSDSFSERPFRRAA
jgi:hypothetical protein